LSVVIILEEFIMPSEPKPPLPNQPDKPYTFSDFVRVVQKDFYYGRSIHRIVEYGRKWDEAWAEGVLDKHVQITVTDLDELGIVKTDLGSRCSNNTKFFMLDFTRYS
jgi:hypothetical protein